MMGHNEKMKSGDEYDAFTRWRRFLGWKSGDRRKIKRRFWKRLRAALRSKGQDSVS